MFSKWLGNIAYEEALSLQRETVEKVAEGAEDGLYLLEHPPVYTFGKSADHQNMLVSDQLLQQIGATKFAIERGGDVTFHGPGQLVGYPIIAIRDRNIGARKYVEMIENSVIELLDDFGLKAYQIEGLTGIWVRSKDGSENKIGAIGIKITKGVTMHGFALNVNTDLKYFEYINPCGILDKGVTSIQKELNKEIDLKEVADRFERIFTAKIDSN